VSRALLSLLLVLLTGCTAARIAQPDALPAFDGFAQTADGWRLSMFRVPAVATGSAHQGTPVLLVHGTATNRLTFMLKGSDLATYLSEEGFDVWIAELRGDRTSQPPTAAHWSRGDWDVDRMASQDVPAILHHITAATGRDDVLWVGHSLGGILGYITLQSPSLAPRVRGLVAIGSPGAFAQPTDAARRISGLDGLAPKNGQFGMRSLAALGKGSLRVGPDAPLFHMLFNAANLDVDAAANFASVGMENIGGQVIQQFDAWAEGGSLTSADGSTDWTAGLGSVQAPVLFVAGSVDHIAPPWTVRAAYDRVGSADKSWVTMGRGWGQREDYGHGDLLLGDWAFEEVFPQVKDWLVAHSGPSPGEAAPSSAP